MTDLSAAARDAALPMEAKKDSLRQTQDGLWKVTFTVKSEDIHTAILNAPMGTRYMLAAVEIGDDEQPVKKWKPESEGEVAKRQFEAMCQDEEFGRWFVERYLPSYAEQGEKGNVREAAKAAMRITSANELLSDPSPWHRLYEEFKFRDARKR